MPKTAERSSDRDESTYRSRTTRGVTWYRSRREVEGLAVVVKRYPQAERPEHPGRNYVLVHGLGVSSGYYDYLAAELAHNGTVWLVNLPGYPPSPVPRRNLSIEDHGRLLSKVIEAMGVEDPVLIGHSMGCQVITVVAAQSPSQTDTIVLLAPTVNPRRRTILQQAVDLFRDGLIEPPKATLHALANYLFSGRTLYYCRQIPRALEDRIEDRLPLVATRALVISGERDRIVPPEWAREVASRLPYATFETVPGGHATMYSAPAELAARIARFIQP